jgi:hypothetical protein
MIQYTFGSNTDHTKRRTPDKYTPAPVSSGDTYDFTNTYPDNRSILMAVAMHGPNLTGVELGLYQANSFCAMLQVCPNIDKLIGVDLWQPYTDQIGGGNMKRDQKQIEFIRNTAINFIHWSGCSDRAEILEMDTIEASTLYDDNSMDFVFFDSHLSRDQLVNEMHAWYPKIKDGGLCIGHDYDTRETREAVDIFRRVYKLDKPFFHYDNTFIWEK